MAAPLFSNCILRLSTNDQGIGGVEVTVNYADFLSLTMDRLWGDSANKFTLKLLDTTAYEVEAILLAGGRHLYMKYYISDDNTKNNKIDYSKEFLGSVWDYSIDFINNRTVLTITGTCGVKVKDIYKVYNRFWNKVPYISPDLVATVSYRNYTINSLFKDLEAGNIKFRYAKKENEELQFQVQLGKGLWYDCDMMYFPVRPSAIVELIANGGRYDLLSPFNKANADINYDDFVDSGFCFGTNDNGYKIGWSQALKAEFWRTGGGSISATSLSDARQLESDVLPDDKAFGSVIFTLAIMKKYIESIGEVESAGWGIAEIEKTEPICADLSQVKMSNTRYINEVLLNKSISAIDSKHLNANYYLSFTDTGVSFKAANVEAKPKAKVTFGQYYNSFSKKDDGSYSKDVVISYSYTSNVAAYIAGEGSNEVAGINYTTGEEIEAEGLSKSVKDTVGVEEAVYMDFNVGEIEVPTLSGISSSSMPELLAKAKKDWVSIAQTSFKAEVQIMGNLGLECGDYIEIINLPGGKYGKHHTSGVYLILKIKEEISKGTYISTLSLVKNAASSGMGISSIKK